MRTDSDDHHEQSVGLDRGNLGRRRFLGYLLAAPTLVTAAQLGWSSPAGAEGATPQPAEIFDLNDLLTTAGRTTANLIQVQVNEDGTVSFALPRSEVGQGITTSTAMIIAEEMDLPLDKIDVTLADARPELLFNQLTGGSNTTISTFTPIRVAAAIARGRLLHAASTALGEVVDTLTTTAGKVVSAAGETIGFGDLARAAAAERPEEARTDLKPASEFRIIGTPRNRTDALAAVTGRKEFATDLQIPDAKPTMVCRPPTINGTVESVANLDDVRQMPGVTDVEPISTGVAVRGETFGQCIDAVRALRVDWGGGTIDGESDESLRAKIRSVEIPLAVPDVDPAADTVDAEFTFWFSSNSALETNSAVADVRPDRAEIWSGMKSPIAAQKTIAGDLGLPPSAVTCHVAEGGGSFGRKLFFDAARESAEASKAIGKPVKLMWHRTDDSRHGRVHPMSTSRVRATVLGDKVLSYEQRHTSGATDFTHGFGDIITAMAAQIPVAGNLTFAQTIFLLTQLVPYRYGLSTQLLSEAFNYDTIPSGSMRNIYSPNVCCARELMTEELARRTGSDPYEFRREFVEEERGQAVLDAVAKRGEWGRMMPPGTAQGIGFHAEYHGFTAALVEIDCTEGTTQRQIRDGVGGPRVTKVVFAVDAGLVVNPRGLEAQMQGGIMDGIALALTSSLHFSDGLPLEGSWDDYFYTRQWNVPPEVEVVIMPQTADHPGGAGEAGVAATMSAVAAAYWKAIGSMPTSFPINHRELSFDPKPVVPPIPQSPTDGLDHKH